MDLAGYIVTFVAGMVVGILTSRRSRRLSLRVLKAAYAAGQQDGVQRTLMAFAGEAEPPTKPERMN